jgi:hypothetical protein
MDNLSLTTLTPGQVGKDTTGRPFLRQWQTDYRPASKRSGGHFVLMVRRPTDLPVFFQKVGALVLVGRLSAAKGRELLWQATLAVGTPEGFSYRLKEASAIFLQSPVLPDAREWVGVESRRLLKKLGRGTGRK